MLTIIKLFNLLILIIITIVVIVIIIVPSIIDNNDLKMTVLI